MKLYVLDTMASTSAADTAWTQARNMVGSTVRLTSAAPCEALEAMENGQDAFEVEDCARVEGVICLFLVGIEAPVALSAINEGGEW